MTPKIGFEMTSSRKDLWLVEMAPGQEIAEASGGFVEIEGFVAHLRMPGL
jgi:hypothetical protein